MKLALIGCGVIGEVIAQSIADKTVQASLEIVFDLNVDKVNRILALFQKKPRVAESIEDVLKSDVELVVEAASIEAVRIYGPKILRAGKSLMAMSVGAFADRSFYEEMERLAEEKKVKIYLPSGAIGGLDALKSASVAPIDEVTLKVSKPPEALIDAPYVKNRGISLEGIKEKKTIFEGNALEAIREFPFNVNAAVALSLAGIGVYKTRVVIEVDPGLEENVHEISVKGDFGRFKCKFENLPSPENPKTSFLAALSAIATLKKITAPIVVGT
jgi:aspartate dehydrogenase